MGLVTCYTPTIYPNHLLETHFLLLNVALHLFIKYTASQVVM